ncbi:S8 family serine peptidase [Hyalangium rubrum]|uniref:S8 family serine peptidase n=1 Tax=Hyalangium rubrum TaxID=3103134 RepID=A0ABU5HAZ0_9BACT|nr:S8 family serine peptidase [Hyalangium sp. s54d21]MDY7230259.1 S8 family serine peptidase [Hyalangium sp. s54d21]
MKRWGFLGLLVLAACAPEEAPDTSSQYQVCPGVIAGVESISTSTQALNSSEPRQSDDGRQRYLVRYREAAQSNPQTVTSVGGQVRTVLRRTPALSARLSAEERALLEQHPEVVAIEPDLPLHALSLPRPPTLALLHAPVQSGSTGEYTPGLRLVQAPQVWDRDQDGTLDVGAPTGEGVRVCVIDSGIDPDQSELKQAYLDGWDFVEQDETPWDQYGDMWGEGHGTHVAGTIAAQLASGGANVSPNHDRNGVVGVSPGAQLLIARVLDTDGVAWMSDVIAALEWCSGRGAHIASMSLGGASDHPLQREAFAAAAERMLIIAAAGNSGEPMAYPAAYPGVLAVGAVNMEAQRAAFSSYGENLALMAPGVDVLSTIIHGQGTISQVSLGEERHESRAVYLAPAGTHSGKLVDCGEASTLGSCPQATCDGFVAYVERSERVPLQVQIANAMKQGARAVIFGDLPRQSALVELSIGRRGHWVPSALVSHSSAVAMRKVPGTPVDVQLHASDYAAFSGTSMATPHVTGVAALLWSARPSLTPAQVRQLLVSTARDLGPEGWDPEHGHGLVQATAALQALEAMP